MEDEYFSLSGHEFVLGLETWSWVQFMCNMTGNSVFLEKDR